MDLQKLNAMRELMNNAEMKVGYVGYAAVDESWKTDGLATPFHRLYFIADGVGTLTAGGITMPLEAGNVYLLPADLPCSYSCQGKLSQLFFHFNLTLPDGFDLLRRVVRPAAIPFPMQEINKLRTMCREPDFAGAFAVKSAILQILLQMHKIYCFAWDRVPEYSRHVTAAIQFIGIRPSAQLRVDDVAQACFISHSCLSRLFRQEVGLSVKEYITLQLVGAAQRKLSHTDDNVEKISSDLGFCSQFHFSAWFKKNCRVSPLQYRRGTKY